MDFSQTLTTIHTVSQRERVLAEFEGLLESLYQKNKPYPLSQTHKELFDSLVESNSLNKTDTKKLEECLTGYMEYVRNLPVVTLTLAFDPKEDEVRDIYSWFLANIKKRLLLDLKIDRSVIGGAVVSYEGKYTDVSLHRKLQSLKTNNMNERVK